MFNKDLATIIDQAGLAQLGVNLFYPTIPDRPGIPNLAVGVLGTFGIPRPWDVDGGNPQPSAQIAVRSDTDGGAYDTALTLITNIVTLLASQGQTVNGRTYTQFTPVQEPFDLDRDTENRFVLAFNVIGDQFS